MDYFLLQITGELNTIVKNKSTYSAVIKGLTSGGSTGGG